MFVCHHLIHNPSGKHIQNCHLCLNMSARNYSLMDHHIHLYLKKMLNSFIRAKSFAATNTAWKVSVFRVFVVCIFSHSDWIWRDTPYLSVFSPNAKKYGSEKTPYYDIFHTSHLLYIQNADYPYIYQLQSLWQNNLYWLRKLALAIRLCINCFFKEHVIMKSKLSYYEE